MNMRFENKRSAENGRTILRFRLGISVWNLTYVVVKDSLHGEKESLPFVQSQLVVSVTEIVVFLIMNNEHIF